MEILSRLSHPNIIRLYEVYEDRLHYNMVTEHCSGGELFDYIVKRRNLTEQFAANVMYQLMSAVNYLHSNNIIHRDLKPENLLLESKPSGFTLGNVIIKVSDFGCSLISQKNRKQTQRSGTAYYIAPEVLNQEYDNKCDIWSSGVILYVLLSGKPPFRGTTDADIFRSVLTAKLSFPPADWNKISQEARALIKRMLNRNPHKRPTAADVLQDAWIKSNNIEQSNASGTELSECLTNLRGFKAETKL